MSQRNLNEDEILIANQNDHEKVKNPNSLKKS
jgi:hypothetical protein